MCSSSGSLAQSFAISVGIETDQEFLALPQRWSAQAPRGAEQDSEQLVAARLVFGQMPADHFFPFGGNDFRNLLSELERGLGTETFLASVYQDFRCDPFLRKKLLRLPTGGSARAMIIPVYCLFHHSPYRCVFCRILLVIIHS